MKCIVMNVEDPKSKFFEVCVNGERFTGETDKEIELKEMFIGALENAVVETMIPDPSKIVKMGEIYKIPKREPRYRVVRLEGRTQSPKEHEASKAYVELEEGVSPVGQDLVKAKLRGNPNWRTKKPLHDTSLVKTESHLPETTT